MELSCSSFTRVVVGPGAYPSCHRAKSGVLQRKSKLISFNRLLIPCRASVGVIHMMQSILKRILIIYIYIYTQDVTS